MQEGAATAFAAFFLVMVVVAGVVSATATPPPVSVDDPDYVVSPDDQFTVDDRTYTVTSVEGDSATAEWVESDVEFSESLEPDSTVDIQDTTYTVAVDANASPPSATLVEERELPEDAEVVEVEGEEYVVVQAGDQRQFVPRDEYLRQEFGEPDRIAFTENDQITYQERQVTVSEISEDGVVLTWTDDEVHEVTLDHQAEQALGPEERPFMVHIEGETVTLTDDVESYRAQLSSVERFHERMEGVYGIGLLSAIAAALLLVLAFNPVRRT